MIVKSISKAVIIVVMAFLASCGHKPEKQEVRKIIVIGSDTVYLDKNGLVIPR